MARVYFYVFKEKWPDFKIEIANLVRKTVLVAQLQCVVYDVQNSSFKNEVACSVSPPPNRITQPFYGTYIVWFLKYRCACEKRHQYSELFKAFVKPTAVASLKLPVFLHTCATCSELPFVINTIDHTPGWIIFKVRSRSRSMSKFL